MGRRVRRRGDRTTARLGVGPALCALFAAALWGGQVDAAEPLAQPSPGASALQEIAPFDGAWEEQFEGFPDFNQAGRTPLPCGTSVLDGHGVLLDSRAGIYKPGESRFFILDVGTGQAGEVFSDGSQGLGTGIIRAESAITAIQLERPALELGARWAGGEPVAVRFFDQKGALVGSTSFLPTPLSTFTGQLVWRGWRSPAGFSRVELEGVNVALDDLQLTPEPGNDSPADTPETELCNSGGAPALAVDGAGRTVRLWQANDSLKDENGSLGVYAEVIDAGGARVAEPMRFSVRVDGDQTAPALAVDDTGHFVAVWQESRNGTTNILSRGFDLVPLPGGKVEIAPGPEVAVNVPIAEAGDNPGVAPVAGGEFVVAWRSRNRVVQRRLTAAGVPTGATTVVFDGAGGGVSPPSIAPAPGGSLALSWAFRDSPANLTAGSSIPTGALIALLDKTGKTLGSIQSASPLGSSPTEVAVSTAPAGDVLVVWQEGPGSTRPEGTVVGRWLKDSLAPLSSPAELGLATKQGQPKAATSAQGDALVVWEDGSEASTGILGRRFPPTTSPADEGGSIVLVPATGPDEIPGAPELVLADERAELVYAKRTRAGVEHGVFGRQVSLSGCVQSPERLCLGEGRFAVSASWDAASGASGEGNAVALTADTGYFWFFDSSNVELVVKVLDGCALNGAFWVFAGGLTDLGIRLTVLDTVAGSERVYTSTPGQAFEPVLDAAALATCSVLGGHRATPPGGRAGTLSERATGATCATSPDALCLTGNRFEVRVDWDTATDGGPGFAQPLTTDTGYFWFFDSNNVEIVLKLLDACAISDRFWVFAAGLTDVGAQLEVVDTFTGTVRRYSNGRGTPFRPVQDTAAFDCTP